MGAFLLYIPRLPATIPLVYLQFRRHLQLVKLEKWRQRISTHYIDVAHSFMWPNSNYQRHINECSNFEKVNYLEVLFNL